MIKSEDNKEVNIYIDREMVFNESEDEALTRLFVYFERIDNILKLELPEIR
jgi:hypothetical protein